MTPRDASGSILLVLCLVVTMVTAPLTGWAQGTPPPDAATQPSASARTVVAGIGAVVGSIVYVPFKAVIMCPVGALASGVSYVVTGGKPDPSDYLLRLGCTGTYFITPAMVQGAEPFRAYDER
jgi:hypothetical protein